MDILFLDIDGVLNSEQSAARFHSYMKLDPRCIGLLNDVMEQTKAMIVVSSTWRVNFCPTVEAMRNVLVKNGFTHPHRIIDLTPVVSMARNRGQEIEKWLKDNCDKQIERFVIVDDDVFDLIRYKDHIVKTDMEHEGLQQPHADIIIERLTED